MVHINLSEILNSNNGKKVYSPNQNTYVVRLDPVSWMRDQSEEEIDPLIRQQQSKKKLGSQNFYALVCKSLMERPSALPTMQVCHVLKDIKMKHMVCEFICSSWRCILFSVSKKI